MSTHPPQRARMTQDHAELLVLAVLAEGPAYGYAITKAVAARSGGTLTLGPSALYPLLARLERGGLVEVEWEEVKAAGADPRADGRRRKWYRLSAKGRARLAARLEQHERMHRVLAAFLTPGATSPESAIGSAANRAGGVGAPAGGGA